ncbi:MAG: tRNA 2-selenouridine(34) synthase MnmH [Ferruginibacter sp.]
MSIKKLTIQQFIDLAEYLPVIDVRSPGEYDHAQIPGAYSLPLFNDEERKIVGTAYKQQGKQIAIKLGLDFFGVKMKGMVEEAEKVVKNYEVRVKSEGASNTKNPTNNSALITHNSVLVHCWRGGMRSAGVAWLLELYGFEVYTLIGGYKTYRNWVLKQFEKDHSLTIIGGYTGSDKTGLIEELEKKNHAVINLEQLANHKGSAFGDMGKQPTQEMFENMLAEKIYKHQYSAANIWLEDESQRIGQLSIPHHFWKTMRNKPVCFIDIPFDQRLDFIISTYGKIDKEKLINSILRIQKRLGPLETKTALGLLIENNLKGCFEILLNYYDKSYRKGLHNRENTEMLVNKISCPFVDAITNTEKLLSCATVNV